jgi:hypothetical protein
VKGRWVLEGEWSGYTSSQRRVVHRQAIGSGFSDFRAWCERIHAIRYTDGTTLVLSVRDAEPRERVVEINGYGSLIRDCFRHKVSNVDDLPNDA